MVFCINCAKKNNSNTKECTCGSRSFIGGDIKKDEKKFVCNHCGENKFKMTVHMDYTHKGVSKYNCQNCFKGDVYITSYRTLED